MRHLINLGLFCNDGRDISQQQALALLTDCGLTVYDYAFNESETEPTLVADVGHPQGAIHVKAAIGRLAIAARQDCVAVYEPRSEMGELIGPNAAAWGDFSPEFFLQLDGTRLAQPATV